MATISIRVDDDTRDQLESHARARNSSLSDLLRQAIDTVLERDTARPWNRSDIPQTLSVLDRRILQLHHEVLARVAEDPSDREYSLRQAHVLQRGFTLEYGREFDALQPELSRSDCLFVFDVLDMFRILGVSYRSLSSEDRERLGAAVPPALMFRGFDFNDSYEGALADYVDFLVSTDRWTEQQVLLEETRGNSHTPMVNRYRRMLAVYKPIRDRRMHDVGLLPTAMLLSADEIQSVLDSVGSRGMVDG